MNLPDRLFWLAFAAPCVVCFAAWFPAVLGLVVAFGGICLLAAAVQGAFGDWA